MLTDCATALDSLVGNSFSDSANICSGPLSGGVGTCVLDSGSPLLQNDTIVGVVSWGVVPCGIVGAPSVYTKVSAYIDFINQYVDF